jgi:predicted dehydrogenase
MILIDIGTHAHNLGAYVTGLDLESLCADVGHVVPGRKVDDYVSMLLRYSNGASGAEHGLCFRIFGETGGLEWYHCAIVAIYAGRMQAQSFPGSPRSFGVRGKRAGYELDFSIQLRSHFCKRLTNYTVDDDTRLELGYALPAAMRAPRRAPSYPRPRQGEP